MTITISMEQLIIDWLSNLGWNFTQESGYPLLPGPEILAEPDRAVFITSTGGPGYTTEEPATDAATFQARVRGPADDVKDAQAQAQLLDAMILGAQFPALVDSVHIVAVHRLSGPPAALPLDPSDRRFEFTCNYVIITGV
jgi:hypothetical protein